MTDRDLLKQALDALEWCLGGEPCGGEDAVRALRERLAQPEQEPVGEIVQAFADLTAVSIPVMPPVGTKLYTTPPRREWVGLTNEELAEFSEAKLGAYDLCLEVEAKLKEKNA